MPFLDERFINNNKVVSEFERDWELVTLTMMEDAADSLAVMVIN